MVWVNFHVKPTPLNPEETRICAPMAHPPRIGETVVFSYRDNTWPRFEVLKVEHFVHDFRKDGDPPASDPVDDDDWLRMAQESPSAEVYVELARLEDDASAPAWRRSHGQQR